MKITQISPNSWKLTRLGLVNCYLVRERSAESESGDFTLIDTTISGGAKSILAAAKTLGSPIRRILLTHAHADHVGSVDALAALLPGVTLAIAERSLPLLKKPADKSLRPGEPKDSFGGGLPGVKTPITHLVADGELFGSLRVIDTPGHIPGHQSFLDERDGTLFAGDELVGVGRLSVCGWTPWYFPLPSFVMWSKPLALASAKRLLAASSQYRPIQRFACGHGRIHHGGLTQLRDSIAKASR